MRLLSCLSCFLLIVPATVSACEGECIVGITNVFLGNYSDPVHAVMGNIAKQIADAMPNNPSPSTTYKYLSPILEAYHKQSYDGMEHAIFPSYFHGKCQQNGVNPPGCPNPDCPVVCGTPGSLVHFYPVLRYLAFNQTRYLLGILSAPDSDAYKLVEQSIMDASQAHSRRMSRIFSRSVIKSASKTAPGPTSDFGSGSGSGVNPVSNSSPGHEVLVPLFVKKRSQDMKTELENIMKDIGGMLENACGGDANEDADGLPDCSWEQPMKEYILTFP